MLMMWTDLDSDKPSGGPVESCSDEAGRGGGGKGVASNRH